MRIILVLLLIVFQTNIIGQDYDPNKAIKDAETPASREAKYPPIKFNSQKAERFLKSPCFKTLGYRPWESDEVQEIRYKKCENAIRNEKIKNTIFKIVVVVVIILCFLGTIFYFFRGKNKIWY